MEQYVKADWRELREKIERLSLHPEDKKRSLRLAAEKLTENILRRTSKSVDYMGRPFRDYSQAYEDWTGKKKVDLKYSGSMLQSVNIKDGRKGKETEEVRIGFDGKRNAQVAAYNNKYRQFFLLNENDRIDALNIIIDYISRIGLGN